MIDAHGELRIEAMKDLSRLFKRRWVLAVAGVLLITVHVIFFDRLRRGGVPLAVVSGLALLVIVKHLGLLGPLYGLLRRPSRRPVPGHTEGPHRS